MITLKILKPILTSLAFMVGLLPQQGQSTNDDHFCKDKNTSYRDLYQNKLSLSSALESFEMGDDKTAILMFKSLAKAGAIVCVKYLEYLKEESPSSFEPIPEAGLKLSQDFLKASLSYRTYLTAKKGKKPLQDLGLMGLNGNVHALSLLKKLHEEDKNIFNLLPKNNWLKKIKTPDDIFQKFTLSSKGPVLFWDCLDPNHLSFLCKNLKDSEISKSLRTFQVNYQKAPHLIGQIALSVAKLYPDQGFWPYLAVENGMNEGCEKLLSFCLAQMAAPTTIGKSVSTQNNKREFFWYYFSHTNIEAIPICEYGGCFKEKQAWDDARKCFKIAADRGNAEAQCIYAAFLHDRIKDKEALVEARNYYKKAAEAGYARAQYLYADMLANGKGGDIALDKARIFYEMSANQGNAWAAYDLGCMLLSEEGGKKDINQAIHYLKLSADQGNTYACFAYAWQRDRGDNEIRDPFEARKYYTLAADKGNSKAQRNLSQMILDERGGKKDLNQALHYLKLAADQGKVDAQYGYAWLRNNGESNIRDSFEARKYYKLAADRGNPEAQCNLAFMYYKGQGGLQDMVEAANYLKLSAAQGCPNAQFSYANFFCKDEKEAQRYYKMAAEQGFIRAIMRLDSLNKANIQKAVRSEVATEDTDIKITLPPLEELDDSSSEEELSPKAMPQCIDHKEGKKIPDIEIKKTELLSQAEKVTEEQLLAQELQQCEQKNAKHYAESRVKKQLIKQKQAKKDAAARTRHTLIVKKEDYDVTNNNIGAKIEICEERKKSKVSHETMNFVKAIFGQGTKICTFSNTDAQKAFAELGCKVGNKKGENSTTLSFDLGQERRMELAYQEPNNQDMKEQKVKYHNPHGHGDDNLYNALKPHLKRFLTFIHKTPETLRVK